MPARRCISVRSQLLRTTPSRPHPSAAKNQRLLLMRVENSQDASQAVAKVVQNIGQGKSVGARPVNVRIVSGIEMAVATEIQPARRPQAASATFSVRPLSQARSA